MPRARSKPRRLAGAVSDGRHERWRAHRAARRVELIGAVIDAVNTCGAGIGMDDIAAASGIAKPVFYRYFTDKADLYHTVGRTVAGAVVADVTAAINSQSTPYAMLAAGIDTYLRRVEAGPELYRFVVHPRIDRPLPGDPASDYATVVGLHASRVIGRYLRDAGLDSGAAEPWGFGVVGMVRASADRWLDHPSMSRDALSAHLSELAWQGLSQVTELAGPERTKPVKLAKGGG
jgi:AcrR family transcriptional regulator